MEKVKNYSLSELSVQGNENGTFSIVSKNGGKLTYNQTVGQYEKGQNEFTRYKANQILIHLTDLEYKDCIDLVAKRGGAREGAGRKEEPETKVIPFRLRLNEIDHIKSIVKKEVAKLRKGKPKPPPNDYA